MSNLPDSPDAVPEPASPSRWWSTFRALGHYNYRLYFLGQMVSLLGTWMQTAAMTWLSYQLTHESVWPALTLAAHVLPTVLFGVWGGSLADRLPRRLVIFASQAALLFLALLLAGLTLSGAVRVWHLPLISLGNGLVTVLDLPARLAFVYDMVGEDDLINAVGLNSLLFNTARAIRPALGGWVMALNLSARLTFLNALVGQGDRSNAGFCFLLNALSYLAVLVALALMDGSRLGRSHKQPEDHPASGRNLAHPILGPLHEGFSYLRVRPGLLLLLLLVGFVALFGWPVLALLPALNRTNLGGDATDYNWLLSAVGDGALLSALVVASLGSRSRSWRFLVAGVTLAGLGELGLGLAETRLRAQVCCVLVGFGLVLVFATAQSLMQLSAGRHNRGVIMGIWSMVLSERPDPGLADGRPLGRPVGRLRGALHPGRRQPGHRRNGPGPGRALSAGGKRFPHLRMARAGQSCFFGQFVYVWRIGVTRPILLNPSAGAGCDVHRDALSELSGALQSRRCDAWQEGSLQTVRQRLRRGRHPPDSTRRAGGSRCLRR